MECAIIFFADVRRRMLNAQLAAKNVEKCRKKRETEVGDTGLDQ